MDTLRIDRHFIASWRPLRRSFLSPANASATALPRSVLRSGFRMIII